MIINYEPKAQELEIGRPYTHGVDDDWFMRVDQSHVVFLGSGSRLTPAALLDPKHAAMDISHALTVYTGFRYAESMEIK